MLVLSRKRSESVFVYLPGVEQPLKVMLVEIRGDKVKLGFDHPDRKNVRISREELTDQPVNA
ncbi:MAG: carbon storage regulator [Planctomyces sp.]|nr:carbon storage regulator [Planctomyces sp.]